MHFPSYQLSKHLAKILAQLVGNTDSHVTNSSEFVSFIQRQKLAQKDILMSFDVVLLFTCVPVELAVLEDVVHWHGEITCSLLYPMCRMPGHLHGRRSCARRWMSIRGQWRWQISMCQHMHGMYTYAEAVQMTYWPRYCPLGSLYHCLVTRHA